MAAASPRALVTKLNSFCRRALEGAAGLCLSRTNYNVEVEHWLLKLLEVADSDLARLLRHYRVEPAKVNRELTKALDRLKTGNARAPELSADIPDLVREAWVLASLEFGAARVRSSHLLTALLTDRRLASRLHEVSPELAKINGEQLQKEAKAISAGSA